MSTRLHHNLAAALLALAACVVAAPAGAATEPKAFHGRALLVGVSAYDADDLRDLPFAKNDAERLSESLTRRGVYAERHVAVVTGGADAATNGDALRDRIASFLAEREPESTVLLYLSCHGVLVDGELWLAPSDFDRENAAETGISAAWLRKQLVACGAGAKLLVLDACHAGASDRDVAQVAESQFDETPGIVAIASSAASEFSVMDGELESSLFTFWLARALDGHADINLDGEITDLELYSFLVNNVEYDAARRHGVEQTPRMNRKMSGPAKLIVTHLKPQARAETLDDMADLLAWHIGQGAFKVVRRTGEFGALPLAGAGPQPGIASGLNGATYAELLYDAVEQALVEQEIPTRLVSPETADTWGLGGKTVYLDGLVSEYEPGYVQLQASLLVDGQIAHRVGGRVEIGSREEFANSGRSARFDLAMSEPRIDPHTGYVKSAEAVTAAELDRLARSADYAHPMADPAFGCRVYAEVNPAGGAQKFTRYPRYAGGDAYLELNEGDEYSIVVDYDLNKLNGGRQVYAKILVDGVSIRNAPLRQPEARSEPVETEAAEPEEESGPVFFKGIDLVRVARRDPLEALTKQHVVTLDGKHSPYTYQGFSGAGIDGVLKFTVVRPEASVGDGDAVGLITVALYDTMGQSRGADVGTAAGRRIGDAGLRLVRDNREIGQPIAVLHLKYRSGRALAQLLDR